MLYDTDYRIVATGYNGSPSGFPHCDDVGCTLDDAGHCVNAVHAEVNAVLQCAAYGIPTKGLHLLTTHSPCNRCALLIVRAGITCVRYLEVYREGPELQRTSETFARANVAFWRWPERGVV